MKKLFTSIVILMCLGAIASQAQVSGYTFAQSNGTFVFNASPVNIATATSAAGTTGLDDEVYPLSFPSGFSFSYSGSSYTSCYVGTNGYITFGVPYLNFTPISDTVGYTGAIAPFATDIIAAYNATVAGQINYQLTGTAPNRTLTIEYKNFRPYSASATDMYAFSFQIKLAETSGVIAFVYKNGSVLSGVPTETSIAEIGLRGSSNAAFKNRSSSTVTPFSTSVAGASNTAVQAFSIASATPGMPTAGLTYTFTPPTCVASPSASISPTSITTNSATLIWLASASAPALGYDYYVSTSSTPPNAATIPTGNVAASVLTTTLSLLSPGTSYFAYVRPKCSSLDFGVWTSAPLFSTLCSPVANFSQNFDASSSLPPCWTFGPNLFNFGITNYIPSSQPNSLYSYVNVPSSPGYILMPEVTNINAGTNQLRFKASADPYSSTTIQIGYLTNPSNFTTFVSLQTVVVSNTSFGLSTIVVYPTSVPAGSRLAIKNTGIVTNYGGVSFDDVFWESTSACPEATGLTSSAITSSTATISWTSPASAPANGYEYYLSTSNMPPTNATLATGSVASGVLSKNLTTLAPFTTYFYGVRSVCSSTNKSNWNLDSFSTTCVPFNAPFTEDLNFGTLPGCWTSTIDTGFINYTGTNSKWRFSGSPYYNAYYNGRIPGTFAWVRASATPGVGIHNVTLTSPPINLSSINSPYIEFDWFKNNQYAATAPLSNNKLTVQVNNGSGWTTIFSDMSNASIWRTVGLNLAPSYLNTTIQVRFVVDKDVNYQGDEFDDILLDNVKVKDATPCTGTVPVVNLGADTSICEGQTLTLNAGAANSAYTKLWSNGATTQTINASTSGTYSVTVTNGFCSKSDTLVLTVLPIPIVNLGMDTAICTGQSITLNAGAANATYAKLWSNGDSSQTINVSAAGPYFVKVSNGACFKSDTIVVALNPMPSASAIAVSGTSPNFNFSVTSPANIATYAWNFGDGNTASTATASHTYSAAVGQTFTVTLIISNDCGSDTLTKTITISGTGVNNLSLNANELKLYPNPAQQLVTIENGSKLNMKQIKITNILGQEVVRIKVTNQTKQTINVANLATGLYNVTVEFEEGSINRKLEIVK